MQWKVVRKNLSPFWHRQAQNLFPFQELQWLDRAYLIRCWPCPVSSIIGVGQGKTTELSRSIYQLQKNSYCPTEGAMCFLIGCNFPDLLPHLSHNIPGPELSSFC